MKSVIKRFRGAMKITFDRSRHQKHLTSLRENNADLSALRSQIAVFQRNDEPASTCTRVQRRLIPHDLNSIQDASQKLHEALCGFWCCDDAARRSHYAKLCIDTQVKAEVQLHLAISCQDLSSNGSSR